MTNQKLRIKRETTVATITYRLQNEEDYFLSRQPFKTLKLLNQRIIKIYYFKVLKNEAKCNKIVTED